MIPKQPAAERRTGSSKQHRVVYRTILERILSGQYAGGAKIPTQGELCGELGVSRPTVIRALDDLKAEGHIRTIQGSGSYVKVQAGPEIRLGLIIPGQQNHEQDSIFPALQHHIMREASRLGWQVLLGDSTIPNTKDAAARQPVQVARQLIQAGVRAVLLTPHEVGGRGEAFNHNVLAELTNAKATVVLLDRDVVDYPQRSAYDLVCMDNVYAGQVMGRHLLSVGSRRIVFVSGRLRFPTPALRLEGLRRALEEEGHSLPADQIFHFQPEDAHALDEMLHRVAPDTIVCDNDFSAALVMKELLAIGLKIPAEIKLASFDDAPIARLLPVTLTTVSQPVEALAFKALETLRDRTERPDLPPVTVQVQCRLVVRESTHKKGPEGEAPRRSRRSADQPPGSQGLKAPVG